MKRAAINVRINTGDQNFGTQLLDLIQMAARERRLWGVTLAVSEDAVLQALPAIECW